MTHNIYEPTLVSSMVNKRVVMLAAGGKHSLALTSKHDVFSCGYNEKGQLGIGDEKKLGLGGKSQTSWTHVA